MYKQNKYEKTDIQKNESVEGKSIEQKLELIINNGESMKGEAPIIFTERKDGVNPAHDIRSDRFEIALEATEKIHKSAMTRRENLHNPKEEKTDGEAEPIQGTTE